MQQYLDPIDCLLNVLDAIRLHQFVGKRNYKNKNKIQKEDDLAKVDVCVCVCVCAWYNYKKEILPKKTEMFRTCKASHTSTLRPHTVRPHTLVA